MNLSLIGQTDIITARMQGVGATVTVTGVVTNGDELGPIRYIEDATAGLALYDPTPLSGVLRGEEITVTGVLIDYNGLLEMTPVNSLSTISNTSSVPPQIVTPSQIGENTESELVQIDNVTFNGGGSNFTAGTHDFMSSGQTGRIYIKSGSPLENTLIPVGPVTLVGISSQYTFSTPANDGYQILPRDSADIIQSGSIAFTSALLQENISTTGFDLSWNVSSNSTASCNYGLTPSMGTIINQGGNSITHSISLTGLQPATFYYAQCYSVNGADTAFSNIGVYSTASLSSGVIRPYFNHSVDNTFSNGVNAENIGATFADTIAAYIDLAQSSLDICVYNASSSIIATAINNAYNRGVNVRYIADDDVANIMLGSLDSNIPVVIRDSSPAGIMHNKFIIVDANSTNNSWILSGSTNWTNPSNLINDYNNMIFIQDESIAQAYKLEFEEMWGGVFGTHKADNTPHKFIVNGNLVELYFSPSDQTTFHILKTIESANSSFEFGLLSFTRDDLGQAVIDKDIEFGISARGIIEAENGNGSEFANLAAANVNVRSHTGVTHDFHHKYLIVDANAVNSDPTVLTGSHNWSSNAENNSDENTLIIHNASIANIYLQEFEKRWGELGTPNKIDDLIDIEVDIFPNPTKGRVTVIADIVVSRIHLYDASGKMLYTKKGTVIDIEKQGIYFVKIITEQRSIIKKIIVE